MHRAVRLFGGLTFAGCNYLSSNVFLIVVYVVDLMPMWDVDAGWIVPLPSPPLASTPPGTHPPQYFGWGDVNGNIPANIITYFWI